ncbi:MAG: MoaD/ThiS family protein [Deltaproteobacteria bacterium]|nr:MoaD/ThiS family protein [Deltaproteobacteria bacterium]
MKVRIRLFGVLGKKLPEFSAPEGIEIELPDGSSAADLLEYMKVSADWGVAVAMDSRILKYDDLMRDGAEIRLLQMVHGG